MQGGGASREGVVVVGGGVSGLGAAWRLVELGIPVRVLEAAPAVGGLAGTHREGGCFLDVGPHSLFSEDDEVLRTVLALFEEPPPPRLRAVKFLYEGRLIDYPLTARGALLQMGVASGVRSALSLARGRLRPRKRGAANAEPTVEDWAKEHFGEHLYRTFFKPYTEQFWKLPCSELAADSIPTHTRLSFVSTLRLLLQRRVPKRGESLIEREALPAYYPEGGFAEIAARIAAAVTRGGGEIHLGCAATGVERRADGTVRVSFRRGAESGTLACSHVISTAPLPHLVDLLTPAAPAEVRKAAGSLTYRALVVLGMVTRKRAALEADYVYFLNRPYNRLFRMDAFSACSCPPGAGLVAVEMPCQEGDHVWKASAEELFETCAGSLAKDGILSPRDVERLLVVRTPCAYPIYRTGWAAHLRRVTEHLEARGFLTTLGRSGEFRYMDVDRCLRRAFDVVEALVGEKRW